jgi:hypothetical protein
LPKNLNFTARQTAENKAENLPKPDRQPQNRLFCSQKMPMPKETAAQRFGSPAADYRKTTDSKNHFFYQMTAAFPRRRRSGGAGVSPL